MADLADAADFLQEAELRLALQSRKRHALPASGYCHYCEDEVGANQLFCGHDCAQDWERLQQAYARAGQQGHPAALRR